MTAFDDQFADRVREVFDTYEEPLDPAALDRMRAALGHTGRAERTPDRPPAPGSGRRRVATGVGLAALLLAAGLWLYVQTGIVELPPVAVVTPPAAGVLPTPRPTGQDAPHPEPADAASPSASPVRGPVAVSPSPRLTFPEVSAPASLPPPRPGADPLAIPSPPDGAEEATALPAPRDETTTPNTPARDLAGRSPGGSVLTLPSPETASAQTEDPRGPSDTERSAMRVVVATSTAFSDGRAAEGMGLSAGLAREWRVSRSVSLSGGAAVAYTRFTFEPEGLTATTALSHLADDPTTPIDVTARSQVRAVALEVPLDVTVDLARTGAVRMGLSVGLTSTLYLTQTFDDQGQTFVGAYVADPSNDVGTLFVVSSTPFDTQETARALSRLDLGRQLTLGLRLSGTESTVPLAADLYARLPLGGLTSRDLVLTTLGLRLRYALP